MTAVAVPLAIDSLGENRFGIWVTVTTFLTLLRFLDGGASNAVINIVSELDQERADEKLKSMISNAYVAIGGIAASCFLLQFLLVPLVDWAWLLSLPEDIRAEEVELVTYVAAGSYFVSMPMAIAAKILIGLQRTHFVAISNSVGHLGSAIATILAWYFNAGLTAFVLCFALQPILAGISTNFIVWRQDSGRYRPDIRKVDRSEIRNLFNVGGLFWILQLCAALAYQCDALIVSHFAGLDETAKLGLVSRMFLVANSLTMLITGPLWPAFREASLSGDWEWVRNTFRKSLTRCLAASVFLTLPLLLFFNPINRLWTGGELDPSLLLVSCVFVWSNLQVLGRILAMLLNGLHVIKMQIVCSAVMTVLNLVLSMLLTIYVGAPGVVIGSIVAFSLAIVLPYAILLPRLIDQPRRVVEGNNPANGDGN